MARLIVQAIGMGLARQPFHSSRDGSSVSHTRFDGTYLVFNEDLMGSPFSLLNTTSNLLPARTYIMFTAWTKAMVPTRLCDWCGGEYIDDDDG
jgi:hypothetical protein